tara:strand:+ start:1608 stop:2795 length:1188 start_codon:yes stop_codon:yes gene_type:complete
MKIQVNKILSNSLKNVNYPIFEDKIHTPRYKTDKEYQSSFKDIKKYSSKISDKQKKSINCIIFNKGNADGILCAYIVIKYLKKKLKRDLTPNDIYLIPTAPSSGHNGKVARDIYKNENNIINKNVIVLDLAYDIETLNFIKEKSKTMIVIDDHPITKNIINDTKCNKKNYYIGDMGHAACGYTWKFFFPKKKVNLIIQMIDSDDAKLHLKHIGNTRPISVYLNYRIIHSPYLKWHNINSFEKIDNMVVNLNPSFVKFVGHYFDEIANNLKEQIAQHAQFGYFEGHPVFILSYNDPALYKMVLRQMVTNAKKQNKNIDFAVTWGWQHSRNEYNIQLSEDHSLQLPGNNLPQIAYKLGKIGGTRDGGSGRGHVGHFYWPRGNGKDIWDLFGKTAKYL